MNILGSLVGPTLEGLAYVYPKPNTALWYVRMVLAWSALLLLAALLLFGGAPLLLRGGMSSFVAVVSCAMAAGLLWLGWRSWRLRPHQEVLVLDDRGVSATNVFGTRFFPWDAVTRFEGFPGGTGVKFEDRRTGDDFYGRARGQRVVSTSSIATDSELAAAILNEARDKALAARGAIS